MVARYHSRISLVLYFPGDGNCTTQEAATESSSSRCVSQAPAAAAGKQRKPPLAHQKPSTGGGLAQKTGGTSASRSDKASVVAATRGTGQGAGSGSGGAPPVAPGGKSKAVNLSAQKPTAVPASGGSGVSASRTVEKAGQGRDTSAPLAPFAAPAAAAAAPPAQTGSAGRGQGEVGGEAERGTDSGATPTAGAAGKRVRVSHSAAPPDQEPAAKKARSKTR